MLLQRATWGLKSLAELLDNAGEVYDEISQVLIPLVERQQAELEKIEAVISETLGQVQILVCTGPMRIGDKSYGVGDFYQAVLEPKRSRGGTGSLQ